jgi:hypothetical protein
MPSGQLSAFALAEIAGEPMYRLMLELTAGLGGVDPAPVAAAPSAQAAWLRQVAHESGGVNLLKTLMALLAQDNAANKPEAVAQLRVLMEMKKRFEGFGFLDARNDAAYKVAMKHLEFPADGPHDMDALTAQVEELAAAHDVSAARLQHWLPLAFALTACCDAGEKAYVFADSPCDKAYQEHTEHVKRTYQRFNANMGLVNQQSRAAVWILVKMAKDCGGAAGYIADLMWQYQAYAVMIVADKWAVVSDPFAFDVTQTDLNDKLVRAWARRMEMHAAQV